MRVVVLGAGRVGSAMARDLACDPGWEVTVADRDEEAFERLPRVPNLKAVKADLGARPELARLIGGQDLVVGAVPGPMGFDTMKTVIETGINMVDIAFFEQDPFELDELARQRRVVVVTDCGIAPGYSNLILGEEERRLDCVESFSCYVGGLPLVRMWPYEYRAVFSPIDVIAEYTRPARLVEQGRLVVREALSEVEHLDFAGVGTLEAFNSDGLRTLIRTMKAPNMKEKTLRYPGHADRMRMLRETGFFDEERVRCGDVDVRPIDLTAKLLFPKWQLKEGEEDLTVMRVTVEGERSGGRCRRQYDLLDRFDRDSNTTSMARTTGYTCTAVVHAVAAGLYREVGVSPPEYLARAEGCFSFVTNHLAQRGVCFAVSEETD
jgi:lysine 6-dehydrogenase